MILYSAKSLRHLQNKTAYQQRTYNSSSSTKHQHPTFPASLHRRAIAKLRTTSHFRDAHQGLSIPTLHLSIWEPPQYLPTVSSDTSHQDRPALLMLDILHTTNGHQLRLIEEQGHGRRKLSRDDDDKPPIGVDAYQTNFRPFLAAPDASCEDA